MKKIKMLKNKYTMDDAYERLMKRSKNFSVDKMHTLFYPYLKINYLVDMGEKLKRLNENVVCMVDMYTGRESVAKTKGEFIEIDADAKLMMPLKIQRESALKNAPLTIGTTIMGRKKVIKIPDIIHQDDEIVYKPFYVVECRNSDKEVFHILFDSVLGDFSLLNA